MLRNKWILQQLLANSLKSYVKSDARTNTGRHFSKFQLNKHLAYPNQLLLITAYMRSSWKHQRRPWKHQGSIRKVNFKKNVFNLKKYICWTLGMLMKYGIYNDGSIFRWWYADVDGTVNPWSCLFILLVFSIDGRLKTMYMYNSIF